MYPDRLRPDRRAWSFSAKRGGTLKQILIYWSRSSLRRKSHPTWLYGSILEPFWVHFGTILEPNGGPGATPGSDPYFWPYFGPSRGAFGSKLAPLGPALDQLGTILVPFWAQGEPTRAQSEPKRPQRESKVEKNEKSKNIEKPLVFIRCCMASDGPKGLGAACQRDLLGHEETSSEHQNVVFW